MLTVDSIPETYQYLKDAVSEWLIDMSDTNKPDEYKSNLKYFASTYNVDLLNMSLNDMALINHRIAWVLG